MCNLRWEKEVNLSIGERIEARERKISEFFGNEIRGEEIYLQNCCKRSISWLDYRPTAFKLEKLNGGRLQ
jgi:hypothetical protein